MPIRMMVMVSLSAAVLAAYGIRLLLQAQGKAKFIALPLLGALAMVEYLPSPVPL